jgi:hypothetical protein
MTFILSINDNDVFNIKLIIHIVSLYHIHLVVALNIVQYQKHTDVIYTINQVAHLNQRKQTFFAIEIRYNLINIKV